MKWYLASYQTNDMKSIKSCRVILMFGQPNDKNGPIDKNNTNFCWKHVSLPCPHCNFAHLFKRIEWSEEQELLNFTYAKKDFPCETEEN